jgi:hypothetical protein
VYHYTIPHHQISDESRDNVRRAHLKNHGVWPCSRELVRTEVFVTECVHLGDLVAFQSSGEAWFVIKPNPTTYAVKLKHSTKNLAHDFGRQLDSKGACHSVTSQVLVPGLAMNVDSPWIGEHMGLLYTPINIEEHTDGSKYLHLGWHKQGQQIHVAP